MLSRERLDELRRRIHSLERGESRPDKAVLPFGCAALDGHLPGGGLELGALHEVGATAGICHETAATLFVAGILARMVGAVLWCSKARDLFAPGLAGVGLKPERVIFAETGDEKTLLAAMEEGLRHGGLAAVVGEVSRLPMVASRRLHLAARGTGTTAFVLHRQCEWRRGETAGRSLVLRGRAALDSRLRGNGGETTSPFPSQSDGPLPSPPLRGGEGFGRSLPLHGGEGFRGRSVISRGGEVLGRGGEVGREPTASVSRWEVTALPSSALPSGGIGRAVWGVELLRCRDSAAARWVLEGCDEKGCLGLVSDLAYGSAEESQFRACA